MAPQHGRRPGELVFTILLVALALFAFHQAYGIAGFSGLTTGGVLPMLASAVMVVSAVAILRDVVRRPAEDAAGPVATVRFLFPAAFIVFAGLMIGYAASIPLLGFMAASAIFVFVSIGFLWRRNLVWTAAITAAAMISVYVIFRLAFQVVLPQGNLWQ